MTSEIEYAPGDWTLLKELPFKVILAAVVAEPRGPLGAANTETIHAARRLVQEATTLYADNALIMGVLHDVAGDPATEEDISLDDDEARQAAIVEAIALSERATLLLAGRNDAGQLAEYKQWIFDAAKAAIDATKSGGFLGFRAEQVSDNEEQFLIQLSIALGLTTPEEG